MLDLRGNILKQVVVTGGAGFIGFAPLEALPHAGMHEEAP